MQLDLFALIPPDDHGSCSVSDDTKALDNLIDGLITPEQDGPYVKDSFIALSRKTDSFNRPFVLILNTSTQEQKWVTDSYLWWIDSNKITSKIREERRTIFWDADIIFSP